jgi:hypothetical protein
MRFPRNFSTHQWSPSIPQTINAPTQRAILYHCGRCGRDFAHDEGSEEWRAVHVGTFRLLDIDKVVSDQWLDQSCPGVRLPSDQSHRNRVRSKSSD